jgi:hypothetical protein
MIVVFPKRKQPVKGGTADGRIVKYMHNQNKSHFALFIISSICMGKTIMLLKVLQAVVTIVVIMSRMMFPHLEKFVVIMPSIIITVMWLLLITLVILKLITWYWARRTR